MGKSRKHVNRLNRSTKKGGRKSRISKNTNNVQNVEAVTSCPNNASSECFNYPPEQHAYYHQLQFYPDSLGEDSKDCVLHTVNNFLGHSAYNKNTWVTWIKAIHSNIEPINTIIQKIEPLLSSLYYLKNEDDSDFTLSESNLHVFSGWDGRYTDFISGKRPSVFDDGMENWEDNREYNYIMAWWLLSFRLIDDTLMFFPMHLDLDIYQHEIYRSYTLMKYIEHRKPNPMKFCLGHKTGGHSNLIVENNKILTVVNSLIWKKASKNTKLEKRQPKLVDGIANSQMVLYNILYQLKDKSTSLDSDEAGQLLEEIIEEHSDESKRVYDALKKVRANAAAAEQEFYYSNNGAGNGNAAGGRRSKITSRR